MQLLMSGVFSWFWAAVQTLPTRRWKWRATEWERPTTSPSTCSSSLGSLETSTCTANSTCVWRRATPASRYARSPNPPTDTCRAAAVWTHFNKHMFSWWVNHISHDQYCLWCPCSHIPVHFDWIQIKCLYLHEYFIHVYFYMKLQITNIIAGLKSKPSSVSLSWTLSQTCGGGKGRRRRSARNKYVDENPAFITMAWTN